ncbi:MAG: 3'-5' exonuclease [Bacteroidota bacterium]
MYETLDLTKVLFLDIETVSSVADYEQLPDALRELWRIKSRQILRKPAAELGPEEARDLYPERAGIYAEFGRIVCISVGIIVRDPQSHELSLRLKSFAHDDETELLRQFSELLEQYYQDPSRHFLCVHNLREFDVPYTCRRMVIQQLPLPRVLDIAGKKPWETKHLLDTLEMWKFGDYKNYTSLKLLCAVFGIPSPKDDIDGGDVGRVYWEEQDLERIAHYCEKDVLAVVQLLLRYMRLPLLPPERIVHVGTPA